MNQNAIVVLLILIILAGVALFAFNLGPTVSYVAIGMVVVAFVALLLATRKKRT